MPRNLDPNTLAAMQAKVVLPVLFVDLDINNQTLHITSWPGPFSWNGNSYSGIGDLGKVSLAQEGSDITAQGASISLSGVDPALVTDALNDVQLGAACTISVGFVSNIGALLGAPITLFGGVVDAPTVQVGVEQATITIPLESRLATLAHGQQRRYTRADQTLTHPDDTAFNFVEQLSDLALRWGN